jgi:AcrR family transcriptional regulator
MTSLRHIGRTEPPTPAPGDAYLDAARDCILDVGWRRTTLTEVARRAGVSRMTIYRTWSDMPRLLGDLMTREWGAVVAAAANGHGTRPDRAGSVERIVGTAVRAVRALRENELFVRIVEVDPELLLPYLLSRRGRSQQAILDLVADQLRLGQAIGEVRDGDPDVLARALLLTTHGFALSVHTMVDERASEEALDAELWQILARAIQR